MLFLYRWYITTYHYEHAVLIRITLIDQSDGFFSEGCVCIQLSSGLKGEEDCLRFHGIIYTGFNWGMLCWNCKAYIYMHLWSCDSQSRIGTNSDHRGHVMFPTSSWEPHTELVKKAKNHPIRAWSSATLARAPCSCVSPLSELSLSTQFISRCVHWLEGHCSSKLRGCAARVSVYFT